MKKLKTGHYLIAILFILMSLFVVLNSLNESRTQELQENGIEAIATIVDLDVNNYKANELEGKFIENYVFTFTFTDADGKEITSVRTVEKKDFEQYFSASKKVNDQIKILYDPEDPSFNTIKKRDAK